MSPRFVRSEAVIDSSCLQCLLALDLSFPDYKLFRRSRFATIPSIFQDMSGMKLPGTDIDGRTCGGCCESIPFS